MLVHELTAIQRDLLVVVGGMNEASGKAIKAELESTQGRNLLPGRIYTNLDELVEENLIDKGSRSGRTNEYTLTADGHEAINTRCRWVRRFVKQLG